MALMDIMAHQHKARGQRKEYVKRFEQRYGMTRVEWRKLKKRAPQEAHAIRMRVAAA